MKHPFNQQACLDRLKEEYDKYGKLIVAFDFDNTYMTSIIMEVIIVKLLNF